ncbi:MAG TPA: bifunctional isocitrate dehydrogenase kinase/phosphatase [Actinomycetota bacterium]
MDATEVSASRLANQAAQSIVDGFDAYGDGFRTITRRARLRFEQRDWEGAVADAAERLDLYGRIIDVVERDVRRTLGDRVGDRQVWPGIKAVVSSLITGRDDWELAETFFNSVTRRIFATVGVDPDIEFVASDFEPPPGLSESPVVRTYEGADGPVRLMAAVLRDDWFDAPFDNLDRDAELAGARIRDHLAGAGVAVRGVRAEVVTAPFFRRKGAYLVGRLLDGERSVPFALALLHGEDGIVVDAVLAGETDLSVLFSFTRSHFHVEVGPPHELIRMLKLLMPVKRVAELYIAIGYHKHGKTELYRDLLTHLATTGDRFEPSPGTPGMVMVVFALPGFDVVFKVIRDAFPPVKPVTRQGVMQNYRLVFRHDRAGRLVEAQEFEHLQFDRDRFSHAVLDELGREAAQTVAMTDRHVVIHHAYVERRVTPLDLVVREAGPRRRRAAAVDFGQAVKDLAATGIFPGELLPKNFGLTRHGRVVCYDYDELSLLTDFCFRARPEATNDDDELVDEGWFGAGPRDVFPEEFATFLGLPPDLRDVLQDRHAELFDPQFWTQVQHRVRSGEIVDIYPYAPARRLHRP